MASFDASALLAKLAKPPSLQEMVGSGDLMDCTTPAAWCGFAAPCFVTAAAWEACIGTRRRKRMNLTPKEREMEGVQLKRLWDIAAVQIKRATVMHRRGGMALHVPDPTRAGVSHRLEMRVLTEANTAYVLIRMTGET